METCPNCRSTLRDRYCAHCGQRAIDLDRPFLELLLEFLRETFEVDGRTGRTLRSLVLRPGAMTRDYLAGARRRYTSPLRLYLVVSVVFFVTAGWAVGAGVLLEAGQGAGEARRQAEFLSDVLPRVLFLLLPAFAMLLRLLFPARVYFAHLIHALHIHTFAYLVLAFVLPLERNALDAPLFALAQLALVSYLLIWLLRSLRAVYAESWLATTIKGCVLLIAQLALVTLAARLYQSLLGG